MSLKAQAIGGVKWTTLGAIVSAVVQLLQIVVLAKFLEKKDFGLMAMAVFVIGISQIFIDMGVSNSIIHKQQINKYQLSSLFWLNIIIGGFIFGVLTLASATIAKFYHEPELKGVLRLTAATFLILPWGQQFEALLLKKLQFKAITTRDIIAKTIGLIVAVILAFYHFGVYALVYANLITVTISTTLLLFFGLKQYRPMFLFSYRSLKGKGFFSFGFYQMGEKLINYFNTQFDTLLIGKILGMEALGLYNVAKTLAFKPYQIINPIITKVAFPVLAKVQDDVEKLKDWYLKILNVLTTTNAPIYAIIILLAKPLVIIFFGDKWMAAIPYLQILSITALLNSIGNPAGALQLAKGKANWGFFWNLGMLFFMPLAIFAGSKYGLLGVAWAIALFKVATIFPAWRLFIQPLCKAGFWEYLWSFSQPIILTSISCLSALAVLHYLNNLYASLIIGASTLIISYYIVNFLLNKNFNDSLKKLF